MLKNQEKLFDLQKLKNEQPDFFNKISPEVLEFILSEEVASDITRICLENGLETDEKIERVAYQIILNLLNQASKENLIMAIRKEVEIDLETAKKISTKVNNIIFSEINFLEDKESLSKNNRTTESPMKKIITEMPKPFKNDAYKETLE